MKSFTHISKQWFVSYSLVKNWQFKLRGCFLLLLSISLLMACSPRTEEQQIAAINRSLAPDGHLTKTHLYIHWPAVYTKPYARDPGGKEIVPAITLKIPFEYLGQGVFSYENMLKQKFSQLRKEETDISYSSRIRTALTINNHEITTVFLGMQPGAKPDTPMVPYDSDPPDVARRKLENFFGFYAVHIRRNDYFAVPLDERTAENPYERSPLFACLDTTCRVHFGLKGRDVQISGEGESLENYYKAKADNSAQKMSEPTLKALPDQGHTDLPKWHAKVDPTQALLNSFILPEDNPEVKGIFTNK